MRDDETFSGRLNRNERTLVFVVDDLKPKRLPLGPREAFLILHEHLLTLSEVATNSAFVIGAVDGKGRLLGSSLIPVGTALVIGRHSECSLRLDNSTIALRQMAVLVRSSGDSNQVHLWDLNTENPFSTEDGTQSAALVSDGPTYFSINENAFWIFPAHVLPSLVERAREAWRALPRRQFVDRRLPQKSNPAQKWVAPIPDESLVTVTAIAPPLLLDEDQESENAWGTVHLSSGKRGARHSISAERLERGLLVGRYERCGLSIDGLKRVSRVHLLLVRIDSEVWAIDTASTNGITRRGEDMSAVILEPRDELLLAGVLAVSWKKSEM